MTPEHLRALADRIDSGIAANVWDRDARAALRAAADQLELVQQEFRPDWMPDYVAELLRQKERSDRVTAYLQTQTGDVATVVESILAGSFDGRDLPADTAPQEDRDE